MKKSFWFWLCFGLGVVFATYFSARIAMTLMGRGNPAIIKNISIRAANGSADMDAITAAAAISPGTKTYSVSLDELRARINSVPDIESASVRRLGNGNLAIQVKVRNAVAVWTDGQAFYPLTRDGLIIKRPTDTRPERLVLFKGPLPDDISAIVRALRGAPGVAAAGDYLEWQEMRRWNLHTKSGAIIYLPEEKPENAISALAVLAQKHQLLSREIAIIDMRDNARVLVK
ncbi:MAG: cell division protein FtsQ/DivIB [Rickettsiales bacterium]|jgi:cell division protein FtsQ|nr:cell division protein FtsQ/DivIB [Rickettsiales bacterium]